MKLPLAPLNIISLSTLGVICVFLLCGYLATATPWLGITLTSAADNSSLVVHAVTPESPAAGHLKAGDRVVRVVGSGIDLQAVDIKEEPDEFTLFSDYNSFFRRQEALSGALSHPLVRLQLAGGHTEQLTPAARRPLKSLPFLFWYQLICGGIVFLAGMSVLAFRPREQVTFFYALSGFGLLLAASSAAVYSTRELAIESSLFQILSLINQFGTLLFVGTFISILWYYPRRIHPFPLGPVFIVSYFFAWVLNLFQVYQTLDAAVRYPLFAGLAINFVLALVQWRLSDNRPEQRAILKWFLLAWFTGTTLYVAMFTVPLVLQRDTVISQSMGWAIPLTIYLGIALGITRYRLFNLERWVVIGWFWFLGGVAVIGLDAILASFLDMHNSLALATALAIAGWLYFPVRQFLWARLSSYHHVDYRELLPSLVATLLNTEQHQLQQEWVQLLQRLFAPLHLEQYDDAGERVRLNNEGVSLTIPGFRGMPGLILTYADRGNRLFNKEDSHLASAMYQLFCRIQEYRDAFAEGVQVERKRVARDLHDDVGARVLTLVYSANDDEQAELARETLQELRSVIRNLEQGQHSLVSTLAELRVETSKRCSHHHVNLQWKQQDSVELKGYFLDAREYSNLQRILREAISNSLRHSRTDILQIDVWVEDRQLHLQVSNNNVVFDEHKPHQEGRGMRNIRSRAEELGGKAQWRYARESQLGGYTLQVTIPLQGKTRYESGLHH